MRSFHKELLDLPLNPAYSGDTGRIFGYGGGNVARLGCRQAPHSG